MWGGGDWLLCDSPLWDRSLSWDNDKPLLTDCFRNIALTCAPCLVLWLSTALDAAFAGRHRGHNCGPYPWTTLSICKLILTSFLIGCSLMQGVYNLYLYGPDPGFRDVYVSIGVRLITYLLALGLQIQQRRSGQLTSLKLTLFWNLMALCDFFASPIYELVLDNLSKRTDEFSFIVGVLAFCLVASEAFMSHFTDPQYDLFFTDPKTDEYLVDHQAPLSRLLFTWLNRLMWFGYKNVLSLEDLDTLRPDCRTTYVCETFSESWSKEVDKNGCGGTFLRPSLCLALARVIWPWMLTAALLELIYDFLILVPPILLDWLISFVSDPTEPSWHGPVYAFLLFLASGSANLIMVHNQNNLIRASVVPRSGLNAAIYRKVFQLSLDSRRLYSLGELCNLVTIDCQRIFELVWSVNSLWSNPLRIALIVALLWRYLGPACLAGVAALLAIMPATALLAVWTQRIQKTQMEYKDTRIRLMNEILNGIKVLKLFAWELPFVRKVEEVRLKETKSLRKLAFINSIVVFLWILAPFLVALCSFVTFILIDKNNVLDPATAFVSLSLFSRLRGSMSTVPQIISEVVRSRIAFRRVISFLLSEEMDSVCTEEEQEAPSPGKILEMEGASFSWGGEEGDFLRGVDLSVGQGDLVAIVGRVGAGKSALISAIVGEMTRTQGTFKMEKDLRVAVVPQTAWIQNATLRQNVLFVSPMDKRRYDSVVKRCCLKPDMKILPGGDHTEIGEKGVNLSGGQKQRVNLARALYHDADLYLLDDPMSAVDAHVASRIFDDVIGPKGMLAQKTRILVTHDLSVLPRCDKIIVLRQGRVAESGNYKQLMALPDGELARMAYDLAKESESPPTPDVTSATTSEQDLFQRTMSKDGAQAPKGGRLIESERMEVGRVQTGVYRTYFRSAGFALTALMFAGFTAHQAFEIFSSVWLSFWSSDPPLPDGSQNVPLQNWRMSIYGVLGLAQGACILTGVVVLAIASTRASVRLHKSMLWSVIRSPLSFFETTPMGRILNRFGKDMESVDGAIPSGLSSVISTLVSAVGILVLICVNHPLFLLIMVPIAILYIFFQLFYVATSRQLRRLQSVSLSPVLSFFSETVQGLSTLHAYGCQSFFTGCYESLVDGNCKVFLNTTFVNRWLGVHLELMGAVIVFIVALLSVLQRSIYSAALIGLTLSYALNVTDLFRLMVRLMTQLETRMVSVERIDEYSKLEEEGSWCTEERSLSLENWPNEGAIVFKNYKMRYRTGADLVLKGIDLQIPGGQKVGIVGRTGAGKTSLAQALFRVVEATSGQLIIDGLDVARLGLHDLRNKLTVIPQDPVLFGGDLRLNLDPTERHTDNEVHEAMKLAHLDITDLNTKLEEGGANLSVGQRQQVCLARAILRKSRILVLDEATAAIDTETDKLIQEALRTEFANCTLLTVAHRLNTVLDYDRILVMDNGRVVEDGPPDTLLKKKNSQFRDLARSAGLL